MNAAWFPGDRGAGGLTPTDKRYKEWASARGMCPMDMGFAGGLERDHTFWSRGATGEAPHTSRIDDWLLNNGGEGNGHGLSPVGKPKVCEDLAELSDHRPLVIQFRRTDLGLPEPQPVQEVPGPEKWRIKKGLTREDMAALTDRMEEELEQQLRNLRQAVRLAAEQVRVSPGEGKRAVNAAAEAVDSALKKAMRGYASPGTHQNRLAEEDRLAF